MNICTPFFLVALQVDERRHWQLLLQRHSGAAQTQEPYSEFSLRCAVASVTSSFLVVLCNYVCISEGTHGGMHVCVGV
jgi:hypothetical protein